GIALVILAYLALESVVTFGRGRGSLWVLLLILYLAIGESAGMLPSDLLLSGTERGLVIAGIVAVARWIFDWSGPGSGILRTRSLSVIVLATLAIFIPILDREVHEHDRTHVELLSAEVVQPEGGNLFSFVDEALDQLSSAEASRILSVG